MAILPRFKQAFDAMIHPVPDQSWSTLLLPRTKFDYKQAVGSGRGNSIVVATVLWIARNFPEAVLRAYEEDDEGNLSPLGAHPLTTFMRRPNGRYSQSLLWLTTLLDFVIDGNAYWLKVRAAKGEVLELWYIPNSLIKPVGDRDNYITHYEYRPDPKQWKPLILEPSEVVHFRYGIDPDDIRKGLSPFRSVLREIFTDDEAANFTAALLRNLGVPGLMLVPKPGAIVGQTSAEDIKRAIADKTTGDKRGEPIVMSAPVDVSKIAFSPAELDLKSLRRVPEERVTAVTGIPAIVANLGAGLDRSTYNNMEEARAAAVENGLVPIWRLLADELSIQLLPDFDDVPNHVVSFDTSNISVLQEDKTALEARVRSGATAGLVTRGEYRTALGFDARPEDDVYLMPANLVEIPVGTLVETTPAVGKALQSKVQRSNAVFQRELLSAANFHASAMTDHLQGFFLQLADNVAERLKSATLRKSGEEVWPPEWLAILDGAMQVDWLIDREWINQNLTELYTQHYADVFAATAKLVAPTLGVDVGTLLHDPLAKQLIFEGGMRMGLIDIPGQTKTAIYQGLAAARADGLGPQQALHTIKEYVEGRNLYPGIYDRRYKQELERGASESFAREMATESANRYRAETIARTETKHAQNLSCLTSYEASDVVENVIVHDGDGCGWTGHDDPEKADGKVVSFAEARTYPLAHPRCVRSFSPNAIKIALEQGKE